MNTPDTEHPAAGDHTDPEQPQALVGAATTDEPGATDEPETEEPPDIAKARQQAARYRAQLRGAETERDQLRDQLAAQRREIINWRASNARVHSDLLDAAKIDPDQLVDPETGCLDMPRVDEFIEATARRFHVARGFTPNRAQSHGGMGGVPEPASLADAFRRK